ncbi:MAG TPA: hypothetical protein DDY43_11875 [Synechococcales bacterium UBA10510]|nr:hypothetical protein [Synechococcales bacterium UBA10510]
MPGLTPGGSTLASSNSQPFISAQRLRLACRRPADQLRLSQGQLPECSRQPGCEQRGPEQRGSEQRRLVQN